MLSSKRLVQMLLAWVLLSHLSGCEKTTNASPVVSNSDTSFATPLITLIYQSDTIKLTEKLHYRQDEWYQSDLTGYDSTGSYCFDLYCEGEDGPYTNGQLVHAWKMSLTRNGVNVFVANLSGAMVFSAYSLSSDLVSGTIFNGNYDSTLHRYWPLTGSFINITKN